MRPPPLTALAVCLAVFVWAAVPLADAAASAVKKASGTTARRFVSVEHQDVGDQAFLKEAAGVKGMFDTLTLSNGVTITYGEAMCLPDFVGDEISLSANPKATAEATVQELLSKNAADYLPKIQSYIKVEKMVTKDLAEKQGTSYAPTANTVTIAKNLLATLPESRTKYGTGHNLLGWFGTLSQALIKFLKTAVVNLDHFGENALLAYNTLHALAIEKAISAGASSRSTSFDLSSVNPQASQQLQLALLTNALADHFLSDQFSSGHLRPPRTEIFEYCSISAAGGWLAKCIHDEDGTLGLHLTNKRNDHWVGYGDGTYFAKANTKSADMAREATALSIHEVLHAFFSGQAPSSYGVLEIWPRVDETSTANHPPLFIFENGKLMKRTSLAAVRPPKYKAVLNCLLTSLKCGNDRSPCYTRSGKEEPVENRYLLAEGECTSTSKSFAITKLLLGSCKNDGECSGTSGTCQGTCVCGSRSCRCVNKAVDVECNKFNKL